MNGILRFLPFLMLGLLGVAFAFRLLQMQAPEVANAIYRDPMLGKAMPALMMENLDAEADAVDLSSIRPPYLFNVFASWCSACQLEHEELKALKEQSGLPLYGMAWRDDPEKTRQWLGRMGNIYDQVGLDPKSVSAIQLGITGAPETYLVGEDGRIVALYRGALSAEVVKQRFLKALEQTKEQRP